MLSNTYWLHIRVTPGCHACCSGVTLLCSCGFRCYACTFPEKGLLTGKVHHIHRHEHSNMLYIVRICINYKSKSIYVYARIHIATYVFGCVSIHYDIHLYSVNKTYTYCFFMCDNTRKAYIRRKGGTHVK